MGTFEQQAAAYRAQRARVAPATVILHPNDFASDWQKAPDTDICCGIRVLSAEAEDNAKAEARKNVIESQSADNIDEELKRQYLIQYCALVLCDPNDIERHCDPFDMAADQIPTALTSNALLKIYDTAERLKIDSSPLFSEATDDELTMLAGELMAESVNDLLAKSPAKAARVRRYAKFILDDLTG